MTKKQEAVAGLIQAAFVATMAGVFVFGVGGCSTVEGIGRDTSDLARWTGERIDNGFKRPGKDNK